MATPSEAQQRARSTYDAAADRYDDPANTFWGRFGRRTVERLDLRAGERVLDVCCGAGASALAAAELVGPSGRVAGVDLSQGLLALARAKARERGLAHAQFQLGDMLDLRLDGDGAEPARFDAVVCVFGVFFVPDMTAALRALWARVRPGGRIAITTWGPRFFEPATSAFWNSIRDVRPELYKGFNPWDRICEPAPLRALLRTAGIEAAEIVAEPGEHPIASPDAWWAAVMGSGYRGTVEQLGASERERVHEANLRYVRDAGIRAVEANVVYATARRP